MDRVPSVAVTGTGAHTLSAVQQAYPNAIVFVPTAQFRTSFSEHLDSSALQHELAHGQLLPT